MKKTLYLLLCIVTVSLPATATALEMVLSVPSGRLIAGQSLQVTLYVHNTSTQSRAVAVPGRLTARLRLAGRPESTSLTVAVVGVRDTTRLDIAPGQFHKATYFIDLPPDLNGPVTLEVVELAVAPLMFSISQAAKEGPLAEPEETAARPPSRLDALAGSFFGNEPIYFLVGPNPTHAKFQISFKYRLLNPEGSLARRWQRFENIYFGYTQTSFWDWESDSAPFYDSSYKPEFFYYRPDIPQDAVAWISRFSFQGGVLHESNGKDGTDSRSLNIAYLKPVALIETGTRSHLTIAPRVRAYIGDLGDNPDLDRYRGYFDLEMAWELQDSWKLATTLRKGTGAGKGSAQFDLTYPLREILQHNLDLYLHMQYYSGFAETLLSYDQSYDFFRIGFSMFR